MMNKKVCYDREIRMRQHRRRRAQAARSSGINETVTGEEKLHGIGGGVRYCETSQANYSKYSARDEFVI